MTDLNQVYEKVSKRLEEYQSKFDGDVYARLWSGNWDCIAAIDGFYDLSFKFVELEAGSATLELPADHWISELLLDTERWPTTSLYVTFDKDGARWSGRVENVSVSMNARGVDTLDISLVHDYVKLKELLVWSNPFLPAEIQIPKAWMLFGPSRWVVATTLFVNLLRKNNSLWMLPDDPLNFAQWFDLDMSDWSMVVKPVDLLHDSSIPATVQSRFKNFHDCVKDICADSQLSIEVRRYLPGDPDPIEGKSLRYGCLVVSVEDKSGWNTGTAFGGDLVRGLVRGIKRIGSDGLTEGFDVLPRVEQPEEYSDRSFWGTLPEAPWVVLEHGEWSPVEATEYSYSPPGPAQFVTGGSSMPGVNEAMKSSVIASFGLLGSVFGQSQIGGVADAVLEPLYSDTLMAFMAHKYHQRTSEHGWDFPFEYWVDGAEKAYTLSSIIALRLAKEATKERFSCKATMQNGTPYFVGPRGFGDFFLGDRVAVHALGMPKDKVFVEQVHELEYSVSDGWSISVGKPDFDTGFTYLLRKIDMFQSGLRELGVW